MSHLRTVAIVMLASAACAKKTPGADPHDMSAAEHAAEAGAHDAAATTHAAEFVPDAAEIRERCMDGRFGERCWTSVVNPTEAHAKQAEDERKIAADHRAASTALVAAEATACAGLAPGDRDTSPFLHTEDIASVTPLLVPAGKGVANRPEGATVTFRAVPGLTAEWLQRTVDCHLARNASLGHAGAGMASCPLVPLGARAHVTSTGDGFAVAIRADDPAAGAEILARAQRLVPGV